MGNNGNGGPGVMTRRESLSSAFLRDILENPADDTPRLVLADWLEENAGTVPCPNECEKGRVLHSHIGGAYFPDGKGRTEYKFCSHCGGTGRAPDGRKARPEFIRAQIDLAQMHTEPCIYDGVPWPNSPPACCCLASCPICSRGIAALRRRERELFMAHAAAWFPEWPNNVTITPPNERERQSGGMFLVVRRGWPAEVVLSCADFLTHAGALFAAAPIEKVTLADRQMQSATRYGKPVFWWVMATDAEELAADPSYIPKSLWDTGCLGQHGQFSAEGDTLSAACVTFGRDAASLPPLKGGAG